MCIFWARKHTICGCIWDEGPSKCSDMRQCLGQRMIRLYNHMAPCADCWKRGDRRLANEERHRADRREKKRKNAKDGKLHFRTRGKNEQDKGEELALPISPKRLATPHLNKDLDPDRVHRWLLSEENNFDCSRVCDPVKLGSMGKDYRAARVSTDWYAVEDLYRNCADPVHDNGPAAEEEEEESDVYTNICRMA